MKKRLPLLLLTTGLILNTNMALADACSPLLNGIGSKFISSDSTIPMDANLYYKPNHGGGVSGGFGAIVNGVHLDAPLIDSHCNDGNVRLAWNQAGFQGNITGVINGTAITEITGMINGVPVTGTLILSGVG